MSVINAHLIVPLQLTTWHLPSTEQGQLPLEALLKMVGQDVEVNGKRYSLHAWTSAEAATAALVKPGDQQKISSPYNDGGQADKRLWLSITSVGDPVPPKLLIRETFAEPEFVDIIMSRLGTLRMQNASASPDELNPLDKVSQIFSPPNQKTFDFKDLLVDLALKEVMDDIASDMRGLPYNENLDIDDRGGYLKKPFGVDPLVALKGGDDGRDALLNAAVDANDQFISELTDGAIDEAMKCWTESKEDLQPVLDILGVSEDDAKELLEERAREITAYTGVVNLKLSGKCAVAAIPSFDNETNIYISFDGITSSPFNACLDEHYFAMLDMLRIDVRSWVDYLLANSDVNLPPANWDIDVKAMVDALPKDESSTALYEAFGQNLKRSLFQIESNSNEDEAKRTKIAALQQDAGVLYGLMQRLCHPDLAASSDQEFNDLETKRNVILAELKSLEAELQTAASQDLLTDYIFNIAKQVLMARGEEFDDQWNLENGISSTELQSITSSSAQLARYPQLENAPDYFWKIYQSTNSSSQCDYDWKNSPLNAPTESSLITHKKLFELLENSNYSGNVVFAFEVDLDEIDSMANAMHNPQGAQVTVSNAYLHIHDYNNGAGDGVELDGDWSFNVNQLKAKSLRLDNDSCDTYGIQSVFGQFLAAGSSLKIQTNADAPSVPVVEPSVAMP